MDEPTAHRRGGGESVFTWRGSAAYTYTSRAVLDVEARLIGAAKTLTAAAVAGLATGAAMDRFEAVTGTRLEAGQRALVAHFACSIGSISAHRSSERSVGYGFRGDMTLPVAGPEAKPRDLSVISSSRQGTNLHHEGADALSGHFTATSADSHPPTGPGIRKAGLRWPGFPGQCLVSLAAGQLSRRLLPAELADQGSKIIGNGACA